METELVAMQADRDASKASAESAMGELAGSDLAKARVQNNGWLKQR